MYAVILAGGGGTRLRPLSRVDRPKPFLPLIDDRTLIRRTVDRLPAGFSGIWVVVSPMHAGLVRAQVPEADLIIEPDGRNTAAAIALATLAIDRPDDDVMIVLPADHLIVNVRQFQLDAAAEVASALAPGALGVQDPLVTLGVQMDRPATEYGYLIPKVPGEVVGELPRPMCSTRSGRSRCPMRRSGCTQPEAGSRGTPACSSGSGGQSATPWPHTPSCRSRARPGLREAYSRLTSPRSTTR